MRLHNTLTRKTEDFKPIKDKVVTYYSCGPTVYDFAHIGNLRKFVFDDTLMRALSASNYSVRHVMNITDVGHLTSDADEGEDKGEKGALREGKTVREVADFYSEAFKHDMSALNVLPPSVNPNRSGNKKFHDAYSRATDFIPEQIELVSLLLQKSFAYITSQAIYFDTTKLKDYGVLTGQRLADKEVGARDDVVTDPDKHHPHDFAVWFFTVGRFSDHSMRWPTPWGEGFPGWHLECSAIIHATLGDPIDIHTGGVDHIGTHHPNEMAQTEGAYGHHLANYWVHSEFVLVDGTKMSKSKNNFYTLADITGRGYDPLVLRLFYLQAHYRKEINFTWAELDVVAARLLKFRNFAALRHQLKPGSNQAADKLLSSWSILKDLQNDLATPDALSSFEQFIDDAETLIVGSGFTVSQKAFDQAISNLDHLLGLNLEAVSDISPDAKNIIAERESARSKKDYAGADKLRADLIKMEIGVDDTAAGPRWLKISPK